MLSCQRHVLAFGVITISLYPRPKNLRLGYVEFLTRDVVESLVRAPDYITMGHFGTLGGSRLTRYKVHCLRSSEHAHTT